MTMSSIRTVAAVCAAWLLAAPAWAFQPPSQGEFVPIGQLPPTEQMPAAPLLIGAYAFVWIAVMVYLWSIWRRLNRVEADLQALERRTTGPGGAR
jgi:CcmD family protein